ncbi:MAG: HNH endonuclease [Nibricoccus sp.]
MKPWTTDELILAMNVYGRLTFGQLHARNPLVVEVAKKLGRTPGSLAMKLCNIASLDPALQARGFRGLRGVSRLDREIWDQFHSDWGYYSAESELRFNRLMAAAVPTTRSDSDDSDFVVREGPTEKESLTRQRLGQQFFRRTVLVSYNNQCCITGTPITALLAASHIVAWADDPTQRLNPRNGLCLAKTQDAAFDRHLITLDDDCRVVLSKAIRDHFTSESVRVNFQPYEGKQISLPDRFRPSPELLARHRQLFVTSS